MKYMCTRWLGNTNEAEKHQKLTVAGMLFLGLALVVVGMARAGEEGRSTARYMSLVSDASTPGGGGDASGTPSSEPVIMAWLYPGEPACDAQAEYRDGRKIDVLKPEYFTVGEGGELILLTEALRGCNGYTKANVEDIKRYSKEQYATVSSADGGTMQQFLASALQDGTEIDRLVAFTVDEGMTGIEIDFEDFGGWSPEAYASYKQFVAKLGDALHAKGKKLMLDGPATSNQIEENWFVWRYADFVNLPVDMIVIMAYDYQYDYGSGEPIAPLSWLTEVLRWTTARFPDTSRLAVGIPSYGYRGAAGTQQFSLLTSAEIGAVPGAASAQRDPASAEMKFDVGGSVYYFQDAESLRTKIDMVRQSGINAVSIWHLGGNAWPE